MALRRKLNRSMYLQQQKFLRKASELRVNSHKKLIQSREELSKPSGCSWFDRTELPVVKPSHSIPNFKPAQVQLQLRPRLQAKTFDGWKKAQGLSKSTKVFVIQGKYPAVREALLARKWVENTDKGNLFCDLFWSRKARIPQGLRDYQVYNHFPCNYQLCIKYNLVKHLRSLLNTVGVDWRSFFPRSFRMHQTLKPDFVETYKAVFAASMLKEFLQGVQHSNEKVLTCVSICQRWTHCLHLGLKEEGIVTNQEWRILTTSHRMEAAYLFSKSTNKHLVSSNTDLLTLASDALNRLEKVDPQCRLNGLCNVWIVKPGGKSRGRGIQLASSLQVLACLIDSPESWVIQKYIENPLTIHAKKFDIRQWVLVTYFGQLHIYFYTECYLRFCVEEWTLDSLEDLSVHLTNNSISKKSVKYHSTAIPGSMWHSKQFSQFLTENYGPGQWEKLVSQMEKIVKWCFLSVRDLGNREKNAFELFGFDFMIDTDLSPWLLEVNSSPSMEYSTPVTATLVQEVLHDSIKVVVDHHMNSAEDTGKFKLIYKAKASC